MDKSQAYITMCDKAQELQNFWIPVHGDFFVGEKGKIEAWVKRVHGKRNLVKNVRVKFEDGMPSVRRYIWLPRLDQLIELSQMSGKRYEKVTQEFFDWTRTEYHTLSGEPRKIFTSLEQIWLAFVMEKKFGKKWNGQEWIKL